MPIDPTGTAPGLVPSAPETKEINMRCRNDGCDSIAAVEIRVPGMNGRRYQCAKCKHMWGVAVGGGFDTGY